MLKVYGIHGQTTAIVKIPVNGGEGWLEVEFKRGRIGAGLQDRPATFPTNNPVTQDIIESSPFFGKLIMLVRAVPIPGEGEEAQPNAAAGPAMAAHPEITDRDEAAAFLKANGAKANVLRDPESMLKYAAKIGVSFPNWTI